MELGFTADRNAALLTKVKLRMENCFLRAKNHQLKEVVAQAFNSTKEVVNEVIDTTKSWVVKAFEMVVEADDVPRYERYLEFPREPSQGYGCWRGASSFPRIVGR